MRCCIYAHWLWGSPSPLAHRFFFSNFSFSAYHTGVCTSNGMLQTCFLFLAVFGSPSDISVFAYVSCESNLISISWMNNIFRNFSIKFTWRFHENEKKYVLNGDSETPFTHAPSRIYVCILTMPTLDICTKYSTTLICIISKRSLHRYTMRRHHDVQSYHTNTFIL